MRRLMIGIMAAALGTTAAQAQQARPLPPAKQTGPVLRQVVAFGDDFRLVGVAVTQDGRLFASAPANDVRSRYSVIEIDRQTHAIRPFPDASWNRFDAEHGERSQWINAQALWVDRGGHLWVLDSSLPKLDQTRFSPKLVEFDAETGKLIRSYALNGVVKPPDALNDVRIDLDHHTAYLTNAGGQGSLIVLDLESGHARQVLIGDRSTRADSAQHLMLGDQPARKRDGSLVVTQADGIALSPDGTMLYERPLTDHHYWRIPTAALRDPRLGPAQLAARVQDLGQSVMSGGLIMTPAGTLIGGDLETRSVVAMHVEGTPPRLTTMTLASDERLSWADGFALQGRTLYIADSRLWEVAFGNGYRRSGPFAIYALTLPPGD